MTPTACAQCGRPLADRKFEWINVGTWRRPRLEPVCSRCENAWSGGLTRPDELRA